MKILVAEDESEIANSYRLILGKRNHEVVLTADGVQCVEAYRIRFSSRLHPRGVPPFDLVILDLRMPNKDGLEAAKEILSFCPNQRIVIASAAPHDKALKPFQDSSNVVEMLQKPFRLKDLVSLVESGESARLAERRPERGYFIVSKDNSLVEEYS